MAANWASDWASLDTGTGRRPVLRFERRLAHPPEKVWRAITEPEELAHWFPARVDAELKPGAAMRFTFTDHDLDDTEGEILEFDPPRLFAFRWDRDVLRFELVADGSGCRLLFTHTLGEGGFWGGKRSAPRNAAGWDVCLAMLAARLDGRPPRPDETDWFARDAHYVEAFGLAEGEVRAEGDGFVLRFERDLVTPLDEVWANLTGRADLMVGAAPPAECANAYVPVGPLTAVEPPRALAYTWLHDGAPAGQVRWELSPQPVGCWLVLTQTVPARLADRRATALAAWHTHLELLAEALHKEPRPWPDARMDELARRYADRLG